MEVESRAIVCVKIVRDTQVDDLFMVFIIAGFFLLIQDTHLIFKMLLKTINIIIIMITAIQTTLEYVVRWLLAKNAGFFYQIRSNVYMPTKYGSQLM